LYQAKISLEPNTSPIPGPDQYESVNIDPIPVPGWYENTQYQYNIGVKFKHSFYSIKKSQWFGKAFFLLTTGLTKTLEVVVSVKWLHLEYCYRLADKCSF
jgi:hypothetical protein